MLAICKRFPSITYYLYNKTVPQYPTISGIYMETLIKVVQEAFAFRIHLAKMNESKFIMSLADVRYCFHKRGWVGLGWTGVESAPNPPANPPQYQGVKWNRLDKLPVTREPLRLLVYDNPLCDTDLKTLAYTFHVITYWLLTTSIVSRFSICRNDRTENIIINNLFKLYKAVITIYHKNTTLNIRRVLYFIFGFDGRRFACRILLSISRFVKNINSNCDFFSFSMNDF